MRKFIFKDTEKNSELILPITPDKFEVSHGINIEVINIHTLGDINLAGYGTLGSFKIECMFPAQQYAFVQNLIYADPYKYIQHLEDWCDARKILRFIVSDTMVNVAVLIEDISYGEKDGTKDVYATITMRKYKSLKAVLTNSTKNNARTVETTTVATKNYVVKAGDTLSAICRKYYGNASLYPGLAKYNNIKNPNLIFIGQNIKLPDRTLL